MSDEVLIISNEVNPQSSESQSVVSCGEIVRLGGSQRSDLDAGRCAGAGEQPRPPKKQANRKRVHRWRWAVGVQVLVRDVHLIEAFADLLGTGIVSGDHPMPSTDGRESAPRP